MDISLMHAGLAAGAALAALPVILHLFMKQKPKHIVFPALRLIRERQKQSKKQLKIKNWLLLALRMLVLALMALALARPTLNSEVSLGVGEVPTALALVFDTSTSMGYTERGEDRLTEAKKRAGEILKRSTDDSEVFVIDSADPVKPNPLTPASALRRINDLTLRAANRPLNQALVLGHQVVAESKLARREVYVLTDGTAGSWEVPSPGTTEALEKIEKSKTKVRTYVLRLGSKEPRNIAVVGAEPSSITPVESEPVEVVATVRAIGSGGMRRLEFYLDGEKNKKDQKEIKVPDNGEVAVTFTTPSRLGPGLHQGMVKLQGEPDPLVADDVRYFTFNSEPATRILLVADAAADAEFVADALAPSPGGGSVVADPSAAPLVSFRVERQTLAQFRGRVESSLNDYAAIFLLNVDQPTDQDWGKLRTFVSGGGGLVIAPGDRAVVASYDSPAAGAIMPGLIDGTPTDKDTTFGKAEYNHPLFSRYPKALDPELTSVAIYHHWPIRPDKDARVLLRFADGTPALAERIVKGTRTGRVLLWATPLARRANNKERGAWNEFPASWSFVSVLIEMVPYLAGTAGEQMNYEAGQSVVLNIDPGRRATNYSVQGPDPKLTDRLSVPPTADSVPVPSAGTAGHWQVEGQRSSPEALRQIMGFSINNPAAESRIVALRDGDLDGLFGGKEKYQEADDPKSLERAQDKGRHGSELFPLLMFLILGIVTAENLLANKFHRESAKA